MKFIHPKICLLVGGLVLILSMQSGFGQATGVATSSSTSTNAASAAPPAPTKTAPGASMSTIVVNAVPPEQNIMPTSRPSNSVYGFDLPVLDRASPISNFLEGGG